MLEVEFVIYQEKTTALLELSKPDLRPIGSKEVLYIRELSYAVT